MAGADSRWFLCPSPDHLVRALADVAACVALRAAENPHPLLGLLLPADTAQVLDVGCGGAQPLRGLAAGPITAVDLYAPALAALPEAMEKINVDARQLPAVLGARVFDAALALNFLEYLPRAAAEVLLADLEARTRKALVCFVPVESAELEHEADYQDFRQRQLAALPPEQRELQQHCSEWTAADFLARGYDVLEVNSNHGPGFNAFYAFRLGADHRAAVRAALQERWGSRPWTSAGAAGAFTEARRTREMPFDQYQRYHPIQEAVEALRPSGTTRWRILDVGGWPGTLREFLPADRITVVDQEMKTGVDLAADGRCLPFPDGRFDAVVSSDTLEHIPAADRNAFLGELLRVSAGPVLIGAPFADPAVRQAEDLLDRLIIASHGQRYPFLEEHRRHGLPELAATQGFLADRGRAVLILPNGYLSRWLGALSVFFLFQWRWQDEPLSRALNAWYNEHFYEADNVEPAYRHLLVAVRGTLPDGLRALVRPVPPATPPEVWVQGAGLLKALLERRAALAEVHQAEAEVRLAENQARLAEVEKECQRNAARVQALEANLAAWRASLWGRLTTVTDRCFEIARLPVRAGRYALDRELRRKALDHLARRWHRRRYNRPLVWPNLEWLLARLELDVPAEAVAKLLGHWLGRQEEARYASMLSALRAAATDQPGTVRRALELYPADSPPLPRLRILLVCGEFPNPVHGGGGRVADFIKILGERHEVLVATWYDRRRDHDAFVELAPYCHVLHGLTFEDLEGGCIGKLLQLLGGQPADIVHYEWPRALLSHDRRLGRHHIYTHMEAVSCSLWIDLRRMEPLTPDWLRRFAQLLAMLDVETQAAQRADLQVVTTDKDGQFLARFCPQTPYYVVNTGVLLETFVLPERPPAPATLAFIANFTHYPNQDAAHFFMRAVWPKLVAAVPGARVLLVGAAPPPDIRQYHNGRNVVVTGRVPDVRPYIQQATVCIAPLVSGAGIRAKVLQYSALHRPSVVTSIAAEGLEFVPGQDLYLADDPHQFAARVAELLVDADRARALADRARAKTYALFDNRRIAEQGLGNLYRLLRAEKEPV